MSTVQANLPVSRQRTLQGRRAGVVTRFAAAAVDLIILAVAVAACYGAVAGIGFIINPRSFSWPNGLGWSLPTVATVLGVPYLTIAWTSSGRTVGDVLFGLRVLRKDGRTVRPLRAAIRALLCIVFPLGLLWIPFDRYRRSLQDLLLGTCVSYDWLPTYRV